MGPDEAGRRHGLAGHGSRRLSSLLLRASAERRVRSALRQLRKRRYDGSALRPARIHGHGRPRRLVHYARRGQPNQRRRVVPDHGSGGTDDHVLFTTNASPPPPPAGAAYISFASGDSVDAIGTKMRNAINTDFAALGAPSSPPPNYAPNRRQLHVPNDERSGPVDHQQYPVDRFHGRCRIHGARHGVGGYITGMSASIRPPAASMAVSSNGGVYVMNGPSPSTIQYVAGSKALRTRVIRSKACRSDLRIWIGTETEHPAIFAA